MGPPRLKLMCVRIMTSAVLGLSTLPAYAEGDKPDSFKVDEVVAELLPKFGASNVPPRSAGGRSCARMSCSPPHGEATITS